MSRNPLSAKDLEQIREKGITKEDINKQLNNFRRGFPPINLLAPATRDNGILAMPGSEASAYARYFDERVGDLKIVKFVPASGAASRMFKSVFEYLNSGTAENTADPDPEILKLVQNYRNFAFSAELTEILNRKGIDPVDEPEDSFISAILGAMVSEEGLNYGNMPKGLIKFHKYPDENRTPVEEHMVEGAEYCRDRQGRVNLHFTVSREHLDSFIDLLNEKKEAYEKKYGVSYNVEFSLQRSFTDTLAVDPENKPFRLKDGSILFRPGGHGALLTNLNEINADLVFIKNIDNVSPDRLKPATFLYKKALAGVLLENQQRSFDYIKQMDEGNRDKLAEIESFLAGNFNTRLNLEDMDQDDRAALLRRKLNRPVRVCGMVKNEGEPGGGPFWTRNADGSESLQIVESAQIDFSDPSQSDIAGNASHFNPVDLVCATRDYQGDAFDLHQFTDPDTGLISKKSSDGRELKAQELPGLWNGSMSDWNTVFVEVPIETFNPVKTITDLLRKEHLA